MPTTRRRTLAALATGLAGLSGCLGPGTPKREGAGSPSETATPAPPEFATCDGSSGAAPEPPSPLDGANYPDPPESLTESSVESYATAFERAYKPAAVADGGDVTYFDFKRVETTVERTEWGWIAVVDASVGWGSPTTINGEVDTLHADDSYVASYFLTTDLVRRTEARQRVDPRERGRALVCRA